MRTHPAGTLRAEHAGPDLRFGLELTELTSYFLDTTFRVFHAPYVGAIVMRGGAAQSRPAT
jgi:aspartyl-tRNA synthetase